MRGWEYNEDTGQLYYVSDSGVTQGDSALAAILGTQTPNASKAAEDAAKVQTNYVLSNLSTQQVAQSANTFLSSYGWMIGIAGIAALLFIGGRA